MPVNSSRYLSLTEKRSGRMKEVYVELEMIVIELDSNDVITTSNGYDNETDELVIS